MLQLSTLFFYSKASKYQYLHVLLLLSHDHAAWWKEGKVRSSNSPAITPWDEAAYEEQAQPLGYVCVRNLAAKTTLLQGCQLKSQPSGLSPMGKEMRGISSPVTISKHKNVG